MHHSPPEGMKLTVVVVNVLRYANYVSALAGVPTCKLPSSSVSVWLKLTYTVSSFSRVKMILMHSKFVTNL